MKFARSILIVLSGFVHVILAFKITTYYESLCPDSEWFINKQLEPVYNRYQNHGIELAFVPYGFANTSLNHSKYRFDCQHGEDECNLNKLHSCLANMTTISDQSKLRNVSCYMTKGKLVRKVDKVLEMCHNDTDKQFRQMVQNCYDDNADGILAYYGTLTTPENLTFIPSVYFDNVKPKDKQLDLQIHFEEVVKKLLNITTS